MELDDSVRMYSPIASMANCGGWWPYVHALLYETHVQAYVMDHDERVVHTEWLVVPTSHRTCLSYLSNMYQTSYLYRYASYGYPLKAESAIESRQTRAFNDWLQRWWQQQPYFQDAHTSVLIIKHTDQGGELYDIRVSKYHPVEFGILSPSELNTWVKRRRGILQSYLEVPVKGWPRTWDDPWLQTYHRKHRAYCLEQTRVEHLMRPMMSVGMDKNK